MHYYVLTKVIIGHGDLRPPGGVAPFLNPIKVIIRKIQASPSRKFLTGIFSGKYASSA